jgi:membrane fusion protein, heavy metal efflux system
MKNITYIYCLLACFLLVACGNDTATKEAHLETIDNSKITVTKEQFNANGFTLDTLQERPFSELVETSGMIDVPPQNKVLITATLGGFVKSTFLLIGDQVKKGQPIITLENPEFVKMQQEYLENFKQLDYLKAEFERQNTLFEEQITSQKNYLKAKSEYETVLAKYNGLKKQLEMLNISTANVERQIINSVVTIYAPISGSITKMNVSTGSYVSPATTILEIADSDHVHLELTVFEKDILKVKKGQEIRFSIAEASDEVYKAEVHLVGTSLDPETRTINVHGHMEDEENHGFLIGMFVDAQIICSSKDYPSVNEESLVMVEEQSTALQLISEEEDAYVFQRVHPKVLKHGDGHYALQAAITKEPVVFLGVGAFQLLAEE